MFGLQRIVLLMLATQHQGSVRSLFALNFFPSLSSPNPCPPLGLSFPFFLTGQVVYLSHVWCPPESTTLLSLLRLFWLFYEETYPRARKKQETQSW